MAQVFTAVIRARKGVKIVAEMELAEGSTRLAIESFIERAATTNSACNAVSFLQEFYGRTCIVTTEIKIN